MVTSPVAPPIGFQAMDVSAGDPLWVSQCTSIPSFNATPHLVNGFEVPTGVGPLASTGSGVWTGTPIAGNLIVSWLSAVSGTDSAGYCTVSNIQGGPQNILLTHHLLVTDAAQAIGNGNSVSVGPNFQINHLFRDSIILSSTSGNAGWYNSAVGEGNPTETFNYDYTTMTADHLVWPGRTGSKYYEYSNDSAFQAGPCTLATGCNPPTSIYFPATSYCTGATATSACVGFVGAMNSSSMPLTFPDYHNFELRSDSVFSAGQMEDASDGTSMGVNIPAIDTAQTKTRYVCSSTCGSPGPFSD
jgi:hypothetical protein